MPLHAHVAEQPREIDECVAETGKRPLEFLADQGAISGRFVVVHGTHLLPHEARLLGEARSFVCMCGTTERDLGDGLPDLGAMRAAGVRLCTGIDSHVVCDPFEDMRALETHERLRTRKRVAAARAANPAAELWASASSEGNEACGFAGDGPRLRVRAEDPFFTFVDPGDELDALVFSGSRALDALLVDA
jgi:cytosine/adenosine deaminase-related metal-dependent hydrolase